ncbi:MAG TPA: hypothetical protein VFC54_13640 [Pseudolabrys sp.]|nr:hypothetical protein [Pseudolabrys sp.]
MTLTARREPTFDGAGHAGAGKGQNNGHDGGFAGAHGGGPAHGAGAHHAIRPTGLLRFVSTVQILGSLLAVPLGLASGYSIYKANFAPETTCQQLRGNIIAMLDKSVDATTRRMLVRRDVEGFEANCGSFDPDAHAAFKRLLAGDLPVAVRAVNPAPVKPEIKQAVSVASQTAPKIASKPAAKVEAKIEPKVELKAGPKPEAKVEAKAEAKPEAKVERKAEAKAEPAQREAVVTDTRWLAAVRQALVKHAVAEEPETLVLHPSWNLTPAEKPPAQQPQSKPEPVRAMPPQPMPPQAVPAQVMPALASPPPPAPVAPAQATSADHPVPPASIPVPVNGETQEAGNEGSRLTHWIAQIPLVGRVIESRAN